MTSNPRKVVFYVDDIEQPNYAIGIPSEIRFWAYSLRASSSFRVTKFERLNQFTSQAMDKKLPKLFKSAPSNLTANYEVLEFLGEGSFGKVKKGKNKKTGQFVAIKFINKSNVIKDLHQIDSLFNEINIMKNMNHPGIISLYEVYELDDKLCLVMELVKGGQLLDKISDRGSYSERDAQQLMLSIFQAIKYMHDRGIAHRDLKPQNILYETENPLSPIKVSDFGLSKVVDDAQMMTTVCGTPYYVAPEVLSQRGYDAEIAGELRSVVIFVTFLCESLIAYNSLSNFGPNDLSFSQPHPQITKFQLD
ncbi:MAG: putative protein serine/threonine kinase [Streblomastix strix]|uniref:Protein kinase domain-containing protein n=1 Tax=Streblomastix strix TaxID=222440 RepID=A0A5J4VLB5_9EUKA|nr:MAG: putative protein serine/threonine kinase [Streblomastix strix]